VRNISLVERIRERAREIMPLSVTALGAQRYDPELLAIDPGSVEVSRRRLRLGYGTPPVVPYAQRVDLGLRRRVLETFPALGRFPMVRRILEV